MSWWWAFVAFNAGALTGYLLAAALGIVHEPRD